MSCTLSSLETKLARRMKEARSLEKIRLERKESGNDPSPSVFIFFDGGYNQHTTFVTAYGSLVYIVSYDDSVDFNFPRFSIGVHR